MEGPQQFRGFFYKVFGNFKSLYILYVRDFFAEFKQILRLGKRPSGYIYKSREFYFGLSAIAFYDVCRHRKSRSSYLTGKAKGFFFGEAFGESINHECKRVGLLPDNEVFIIGHVGNIA